MVLTFFCVFLFIILSLLLNGVDIVSIIKEFFIFNLTKRTLTFRIPRKRVRLTRPPTLLERKKGVKETLPVKLDELSPISNLPVLAKSSEVYSQERLPVKEITPGYIECEGNRFVKILEIKALNFFTQKEADRLALLSDFRRLLNSGPYIAKLKVLSRRSDLTDFKNKFSSTVESEKDPGAKHLGEAICEQVKNLSDYTALDHAYYFIFEIKAKGNTNEDRIDALNILSLYSEKVIATLSRRGIEVRDHSQSLKFNEEILFNFYNRNPELRDSLTKRKQMLEELETTSPKSLIAPRGFDLKNKEVIVIDGVYYAFLTITDFPKAGVDPAFLNFFTNVGEGFDFDLIYRRERKKDIRARLKRRNLYTQTNADQMGPYSGLLQKTRELIFSNNEIFSLLESDNEFFYFTLICTTSASSYEEAIRKRNWLKDHFESYNFKATPAFYNCEEVYELTEPTGSLNGVFERQKRNVLSDALTNFYPFTASSLENEDGILLGVDKNNLSPVILDIFSPIMNGLIIGATGFGKSYLSMMLATRLRLSGVQVFVITPIKGHEYRKICEELGGSFIELGPGSKDSVNILEVAPVYKVEIFDENETILRETSYLSEEIEELIAFFSLINEGLTKEARDLLPSFLINFYYGFGITEDNNSLYEGNRKGNPLKKMPVLQDLKEALEGEDRECLRNLAPSLTKFTDGNLKSFNRETNVNLSNPFCVIDLSRAIEYNDTRCLVNFIVQNFIWSRIRSDRTHRKAILYEEIWKFLDNRETARTIREVFKTIRGFYGSAIAVTQNLEDLTENPFHVADGILNNTLFQFIFHTSSDEAEKLTERFKLGEEDYNFITGARKGEVLIVSPREHTEALVLATEMEGKLYETDGNKL